MPELVSCCRKPDCSKRKIPNCSLFSNHRHRQTDVWRLLTFTRRLDCQTHFPRSALVPFFHFHCCSLCHVHLPTPPVAGCQRQERKANPSRSKILVQQLRVEWRFSLSGFKERVDFRARNCEGPTKSFQNRGIRSKMALT